MAKGGGVSFRFESKSVDEIIKKRGLQKGGRAQQFVDDEVIRRMEPYMPRQTGEMIESMVTATEVGSGEVIVDTPYARKRSISARIREDAGYVRGPRFFERFKADCADDILRGAAEISGGEAKK